MNAEDVRYVRERFVPLVELCIERGLLVEHVHGLISERRMPAPTYVLPDGTEMVPPDYFQLLDDAGGFGRMRQEFARRWNAAAEELAPPGFDLNALPSIDEEWDDYLSGTYGVCLREVTPERMAEKTVLVMVVEDLLRHADPEDAGWRAGLRLAVDRLDEIEQPFAAFDRQRFGGPVSRDRLVTAVRERYPAVFAPAREIHAG